MASSTCCKLFFNKFVYKIIRENVFCQFRFLHFKQPICKVATSIRLVSSVCTASIFHLSKQQNVTERQTVFCVSGVSVASSLASFIG
ncbi:hypothetical protein L596_024450 [Steinernema carpocapsae]|uniref:Uncharacterized protein n=1 Tax=Steinernema carpocapsae TaxID=34508 RepID=A0A4U5MGS7_STECR|nr:hypothetical protein L596_024450 [Steinernema carpocapsae]